MKLLRRSEKDTDRTQDNEFKTRMLILEASRLAGKLHEQLKELEALQEDVERRYTYNGSILDDKDVPGWWYYT